MHLPDRLAVRVLERAAVGFRRKGEQLVERAVRLEALFAEDGNFFGATHRLGHWSLDDNLADTDVRQLTFPQDVRTTDARGADRRRELFRVALVDRHHRGARFIGTIWENEARGLARFEPDAELQPGRYVVGYHAAGQQWLDGLRVMDVTLRDVAGHDAEDEGFREVDAEDDGIVMGVAMQGRRLDLDIIEAGDRHALPEVLDMAVAALTGVSVRLFVDIEVAEVEGALM